MKPNLLDLGCEPSDLHVTVSELMIATADESDDKLDRAITGVGPRIQLST